MSAADVLAAEASTSATCPTSRPRNSKMFMVCAAMVAASARSIWPAAASDRLPASAPPMMSLVLIPALASSASACAACVAEYWVSLPACRAAARSAARSLPAAPLTADTSDICLSKSVAAFAA
jgi:hypothetical protein